MKKIIATLTVIAAAALGAQGQTTNTFPNTPATVGFTNLTFEPVTATVPGSDAFNGVKLLFGITGVTNTATFKVSIYNITLSGQGISGSLSFSNDVIDLNRPSTDIPNLFRFIATETLALSPTVPSWDSTNNLASFDMDVLTPVPSGARVYYAVQYSFNGATQVNTAFGNVNLVAVPEPSAYAAAAGLLALFLWSSRRHLFKLAGTRSAASGPGENGAA